MTLRQVVLLGNTHSLSDCHSTVEAGMLARQWFRLRLFAISVSEFVTHLDRLAQQPNKGEPGYLAAHNWSHGDLHDDNALPLIAGRCDHLAIIDRDASFSPSMQGIEYHKGGFFAAPEVSCSAHLGRESTEGMLAGPCGKISPSYP